MWMMLKKPKRRLLSLKKPIDISMKYYKQECYKHGFALITQRWDIF